MDSMIAKSMDNNFGSTLNTVRMARSLSTAQLAKLADMSQPLICNLINNRRVIGEYAARKLGAALDLHGKQLEDFVLQAINQCTAKVLNASKAYPSEILNLVAGELNAMGIVPEKIVGCIRYSDDADAALLLDDGKSAFINVDVAIR